MLSDAFLKRTRCFVNSKGEVWSPTGGWDNLVETSQPRFNDFFSSLVRGKIKFPRGRVIVLHDAWSVGYFHWLVDFLPKLYLLDDDLNNWTIVFPKKLQKFQIESFEILPLPSVIWLESWEILFCKELHILRWNWQSGVYPLSFYKGYERWLYKKFVPEHIKSFSPGGITGIIVSRQDASARRITNFQELLLLGATYGMSVVNPSEMSFLEQIEVFAKSTIIIGAHGVGLVNMLFMNSRSYVIEIRNTYPEGNNCYERLAALKEHNYFPICPYDESVSGIDFQKDDITVPINKLRELLNHIFGIENIN